MSASVSFAPSLKDITVDEKAVEVRDRSICIRTSKRSIATWIGKYKVQVLFKIVDMFLEYKLAFELVMVTI